MPASDTIVGASCIHAVHTDNCLRIIITYFAEISELTVNGVL